MPASDAAWVDVLPQMKGFAAPLLKGVRDASKKAGEDGGRALAEGMNDGASKVDLDPVVKELEGVAKAAEKSAADQAKAARKAESEIGKSQERLIDARGKERAAAAQVAQAEADLEKRRAAASAKTDAVSRAERDLAKLREKADATADQIAAAESKVALERANAAKADADVVSASAKLESAREKQASMARKLGDQEGALRAAVRESKVAQEGAREAAEESARAQQELAQAAGESAARAEKTVPAWKRMWEGVTGDAGLKGRLSRTFKGIGRDGEATAKDVARDFKKQGSVAGDGFSASFIKGMAPIGAAIGSLAAGGALFDSAAAGAENQGILQASLGLSPEDAAKAGKQSGRLYAEGWGGSLEDSRAAVEASWKYFGEGPDSEWAARTALGFEKAFGSDSQENIKAVEQMMRTGLIDTPQEGFDILARGYQTGADKAGDLTDTMTEYGTQFRNLGLSGADAIGLMNQGLDNGARDADKVADAFKEFGIRAVDGSKSTAEAFSALGFNADDMAQRIGKGGDSAREATGEVLDALRGVEDPAKRAQIAVGLFGTQAEDLGGALYSLDLDTAASGLGQIEGAADGVSGVLKSTMNPLERIKRGFGGWAQQLGAKVFPAINWVLDGLGGIKSILFDGDFTGAGNLFGLQEDSGFVSFLFDVRDAVIGVKEILFGGNFVGSENFLGIEEDSALVDFLFGIRDAGIALWEKVLKPIGAWIGEHWDLIAGALGGLLAFFVGGALVSAIGAVAGAVGGFLGGISLVGAAVAAAVSGITAFFTGTETGRAILAGFVGFVVDVLWPGVVGAFDAVKRVIGEVWPVVQQVFGAVRDYAVQIWEGVVIPAFKQFSGFLRDTVFPIVERLWTEYVQPAFLAIGDFISRTWENVIKPAVDALTTFLTETLAPTIVWLWENVVSPAFTKIGDFISWAWDTVIFPALDALKFFLTQILAPAVSWFWKNVIQPAWAGISKAIEVAWAVISVIFNVIKWTIDNVLAPVFTWLWKNIIVPAWDGIKSALDTGWTWMKDHVFTPLMGFIEDKVAPAFQKGVDAIGRAWEGLKALAMAPVRFVVESVINNGIISNFNKIARVFDSPEISPLPVPGMPSTSTSSASRGVSSTARAAFADGGVVPGWSPGRDIHTFYSPTGGVLELSGGEPVLRPEAGQVLGRGWVDGINAAARMGGTAGVQSFLGGGRQALAGGGFVSSLWEKAKGYGGDALDTLGKGWDFATAALSDPKGALTKVADAILRVMPGAGQFRDVAKAVPAKVISTVAEKVLQVFDVGGSDFGPVGGGSGGSLSQTLALARSMGLVLTSSGRRGARTAQAGLVSLHALGRAHDYAGSAAKMMAFFNAVDARFSPTELLYSPAGARNKHRSGRRGPNVGATLRNHYSHVHVGFKDGGLLDLPALTYDSGGWLKPGVSLVNNASGRPEPIFTGAQGDSILKMIDRGGAGSQVQVQIQATQLSDADVDRLAEEILRRVEMAMADA